AGIAAARTAAAESAVAQRHRNADRNRVRETGSGIATAHLLPGNTLRVGLARVGTREPAARHFAQSRRFSAGARQGEQGTACAVECAGAQSDFCVFEGTQWISAEGHKGEQISLSIARG